MTENRSRVQFSEQKIAKPPKMSCRKAHKSRISFFAELLLTSNCFVNRSDCLMGDQKPPTGVLFAKEHPGIDFKCVLIFKKSGHFFFSKLDSTECAATQQVCQSLILVTFLLLPGMLSEVCVVLEVVDVCYTVHPNPGRFIGMEIELTIFD